MGTRKPFFENWVMKYYPAQMFFFSPLQTKLANQYAEERVLAERERCVNICKKAKDAYGELLAEAILSTYKKGKEDE